MTLFDGISSFAPKDKAGTLKKSWQNKADAVSEFRQEGLDRAGGERMQRLSGQGEAESLIGQAFTAGEYNPVSVQRDQVEISQPKAAKKEEAKEKPTTVSSKPYVGENGEVYA